MRRLVAGQDAAPADVARTHGLGRPGVTVRAYYGALPSMAGRGHGKAGESPLELCPGSTVPRTQTPRWRAHRRREPQRCGSRPNHHNRACRRAASPRGFEGRTAANLGRSASRDYERLAV
jgi:hypothetical protein